MPPKEETKTAPAPKTETKTEPATPPVTCPSCHKTGKTEDLRIEEGLCESCRAKAGKAFVEAERWRIRMQRFSAPVFNKQ